MNSSQRAVLSPCTGVCEIATDGLCQGCGRSAAEIARWPEMDDAERTHVMQSVLPRRRASAAQARSLSLAQIQAALHPLDAEPDDICWNLAELADVIAAEPPPGATLSVTASSVTASSVAAAPVAAAVLVGLLPRKQGLQVLLTRRTDDLRHHAGQVSFPGGRIEPSDRDARAAVERECFEEIGVDASQLTPLGWLDRLATISGFSVLPLVAIIAPDYVARPDPTEVAEVFELPLAYLMAVENLRSVPIQWRGRARQVLEFVDTGVPGQRVWGATASILYNLRQRLHNRALHTSLQHPQEEHR